MANITPTSYLAGCKTFTAASDGAYTATAGTFANNAEYFCIPLSTLTGAVSNDIRPSLGDIRKIMFAFETAIYDAYDAIAVADRPTRWINSRSQSFSSDGLNITRNFNHQITTAVSGEEVIDEPS